MAHPLLKLHAGRDNHVRFDAFGIERLFIGHTLARKPHGCFLLLKTGRERPATGRFTFSLEIAYVCAEISFRVPVNFLTCPRKFLYVWKFTRIRMEINLHTYAISRGNEKR